MSQQNTNTNNTNRNFDLTDTVIKADPIAVGFNISGNDIADFVQRYLEVKGIRNSVVAVQAINTGTVQPKLGLIVSFNKSNKEILSNSNNDTEDGILPVFMQNIQTGGLRASHDLSSALSPLTIEKKTKIYKSPNNKKYVYVPLCPFKTLAVMLKSTGATYINIVGVHRVKGEVLVTVFKQLREAALGKGNNSTVYDESMNRHF